MGRISGSRNRDHELTRSRLVESLARRILMAGGARPSLRVLAEGAGVDPGALRHYSAIVAGWCRPPSST